MGGWTGWRRRAGRRARALLGAAAGRRMAAAAILPALAAGLWAPALAQRPRELLDDKRQGEAFSPRVVAPTPERQARLRVPDGFEVSVFAEGLGRPRMLAVGEDGTVFVTRRDPGDVLALRDEDGDGRAEPPRTILELPDVHGIALRGGALYLATEREVLVSPLRAGSAEPPRRLLGDLPPAGNHPNRTLGFGPDGQLYLTVGSTCNCCLEQDARSATIMRLDPADGAARIWARGLRNTIGFAWHPRTGELWGLDHGSDWLGDEVPPEELNLIREGADYGWPFVWGDRRTIPLESHPAVGDLQQYAAGTTPPVLGYQAHAAPIQMVFYTAAQFPAEYQGDAFAAMHGSWNRGTPAGYEVVRIRFDESGRPEAIEPFLTGFLDEQRRTTCGRPAGIAVAADGSLLVGDDANGVLYRIRRADAGRE